MNLAQKLACVGLAAASGVLAAFIPSIVEATPVDPAIMKRFEERPAAEERLGALQNRLLIERGRRLFMEETFNGNGRTCATCHPPTNNFTIDPAFIAGLPESDPLFVAEFNPDLAQLEGPELMRRFGLILENLDGFDRPGVFRGVPHTFGLRLSTRVEAGDANLTRTDGSTVVHAIGWSGDGAPGDGSLRSFAIGAVVQHFTKTMERVPGKDFRLPTESELDALEAFQMSLGRQAELDLATMPFADADVQAGKDLFNGVGTNRGCAPCHDNAGANNDDGFNRNFATNVVNLPDTEARRFDPEIPGEGGFDREPEYEVPGIAASFYGNTTINTASLVEAADTGPFFHNNSARTIEDAVRFYTTPTFSADNPFQLNGIQINQLAAFLRAVNALENVRNVSVLAKDAQRQPPGQARQTIQVVIADTEDAIEALTRGPLDLHPEAVGLFHEALGLAEDARDAERPFMRNASLRRVQDLMQDIPDLILQSEEEVSEGDDDAVPPEDGEGDGEGALPPEDRAEGDGDAAPPPEDGTEGDAAPPPEDRAEGDGDAVPPPADRAEGDGAVSDGDAAGDGDRAGERAEEREIAAAS
jgi:cytochrome c peroxidase